MLSFHPHVACSFTVFLSGVLVVILVSAHVMTDTVVFVTMVIMFVTMLVAMVMMVVCTTHCRNGNGECFDIFCFEFEHVFSGFEFVN